MSPDAEGGFSVFVPELPSVSTQGETREEALEMAKEAIEGYLETMHEDGLPVPVHGNRPLKRGTLLSVLRTAGLSRADLRRLLSA